MEKYTAVFKFPINFHSNSEQARSLRNATPETHPDRFGVTLICVINNTVYWKQPKHSVGVINLRTKGGKWVESPLNAPVRDRCDAVTKKILEHIGAVPASFRGAPRLK
ncbi:hypothetical protein [Vibrio parahaemolyticus]|uniref:hypothetical protein n=1 Tax=Vibrio parahaemolyticus TaxID=670 RepID=UPI0028D91334|nr:hypothetical protein [Vibrio parahaemolyticus]MEA5377309.1 hypothetical protein [Vibrio parahaemolyticus]HDZ9162569.1 hypothetical protein [Vibrio cholerae]